jgi:hypothetical protein
MAEAIYCRNGHFNGYMPDPNPSYDGEKALHGWQVPLVEKELARRAFCPTCGLANVFECQHCEAAIESDEERAPERPAYCSSCGKPFPWTETALAAAMEYTDELDELSTEDKAALKATLNDLTADTPRTELAATRFKKFVRKVAPAAGETLTKIMVNVFTEAAKKMMGI